MRHRLSSMSVLWLTLALIASLIVANATVAGADDGDGCVAIRDGDSVTVTWVDEGGRHVLRRDSSWLATPGTGVSAYIDQDAPLGATYTVRTRDGDVVTDRSCSEPEAPAMQCDFTRVGPVVTITWTDNGGSHVLRRNGGWLSTPGSNTDTFVDQSSPRGATYELRTRQNDTVVDTTCDEGEDNTPAPTAEAERVIHVSIDGLRVDAITPELMANLSRLVAEGASTMNARTDP